MVHYFMYNIEKANFQNCDKLIFLSEEMKKTATSSYHLAQNKLFVQYPFVNIDTSSTTNNLSDLLLKKQKTHCLRRRSRRKTGSFEAV